MSESAHLKLLMSNNKTFSSFYVNFSNPNDLSIACCHSYSSRKTLFYDTHSNH